MSHVVACPVESCDSRVYSTDIHEHYVDYHRREIMGTRRFNIPKQPGLTWNKLIIESGKSYIFRMTVLENHVIAISLEYINNFYTSGLLYQMKFHSMHFETVKTFPVKRYKNEKYHEISNMEIIRMEDMKDLLKHRNILVELSVEKQQNTYSSSSESIEFDVPGPSFYTPPPQNDQKYSPTISTGAIKKSIKSTDVATSIEGEFECPICNEPMNAPIYICLTGHSICNRCKPRLTNCPFCKSLVGNGRNFSLERLVELSSTLIKLSDLKISNSDNEDIGNKRIFCCPMCIHCDWEGTLVEMDRHMDEGHRNSRRTPGVVRTDLNVHDSERYYMYKFENQLFRFNLKHSSDQNKDPYVWAMEHMTDSTSGIPQYLYTLQFVDQTNSNRVLTVNEYCFKWQEYSNETGSHIIIDPKMLRPFTTIHNTLYYNLDIKRVTS